MRHGLSVLTIAIGSAITLGLQAQDVARPVLTVEDLTPKFVAFYEAASGQGADPNRRWELWKQMYGFAAVPPTPQGDQMARRILDAAWPRYASALPAIRQGIGNLQPAPEQILQSVASTLDVDVPIRAKLLLFVGGFDNNAFTSPGKDGVPTVALPVEGTGSALILTHEFTHVVEAEEAHLSLDWKRSLAHTVYTEGLAMRVTQHLHPGLPDKDYVGEFSPNWYARAEGKRSEILADVAPHLADSDPETVMRYTMGTAGAGVEREAYFSGWLVIGELLQHGWTFHRLARESDADMQGIVAESLARLQKQGAATQH